MSESQTGRAALYVLSAMALIGLIDNLVPMIAARAGLWQFHVVRALMALPLVVLLAVMTGWKVRPVRPWAVALRSLALGLSMLCYFGALGAMPVAEAAAGLFAAPLIVLLVSAVLLGRPVPGRVKAAIALGFLGVLAVLRPDPVGAGWVTLLPLLGAVFYAGAALATRELCAEEGALSLLAGFLLAMLVLGAAGLWAVAGSDSVQFLARPWVPLEPVFLGLTALQAGTVIVGVGLITKAYLIAPAPHVAGLEYALLIFAALWGWVLWGEAPDALAWAGIALIVGSGALIALTPQR